MTTEASPAGKAAVNGIRTALGIGGVLSVIIGALIVWQPLAAAAAVAIILGIYAIVGGLVYAGLGIFSKTRGGWSRVGHIVLGLLFIVAGILIFIHPGIAAASLATFVAIIIGIMWIIEGIVALSTLGQAAAKGWTVFFAIISIIAGIFVLLSPLWAAAVLWLFLGISLIVLGIIQIVRAFTFSPADI